MFERFTTAARDVTVRAQTESRSLGSPAIGTEHLLLALTDDAADLGAPALASMGITRAEVLAGIAEVDTPDVFSQQDADALRAVGIDVDAVLERISQTFGQDALERARRAGAGSRRGHRSFGKDAKEALRCALQEGVRQRTRQLDDGAILVGVVEAEGTATRILASHGVGLADVRQALDQIRRRSA